MPMQLIGRERALEALALNSITQQNQDIPMGLSVANTFTDTGYVCVRIYL